MTCDLRQLIGSAMGEITRDRKTEERKKKMTDHFNLSANRMFRAMRATADTVRPYLQGVYVEPIREGGAWLVASNGNVMLIQRERYAVVPVPAILRVTPPMPPADVEEDDEVGGYHWCDARLIIPVGVLESPQLAPVYWHEGPPGCHAIAECNSPAEEYPDWRRVLDQKAADVPSPPFPPAASRTSISLDNLELITPPSGAIRMRNAGPGRPWLITYTGDPDCLGVLSPVRSPSNEPEHLADMLRDLGRKDIATSIEQAPRSSG